MFLIFRASAQGSNTLQGLQYLQEEAEINKNYTKCADKESEYYFIYVCILDIIDITC